MKHEVDPKEVTEVLKECKAFIEMIQEYRFNPARFQCGFDQLVDVFETRLLIVQIENILTGFGIIFDSTL